jgi:anti-sigma factor RsiW
MAHLRPEQFVDIVDGVLAETGSAGSDVAAHLSTCAACRQQLADVRTMMAEAVDAVDIVAPEPSPLFWDHLSARVHDAVAEEAARRPSWREWLPRPRVWAPVLAGALAVALFVVRQPQTSSVPSAPQPAPTNVANIPAAPLVSGDGAAVPSPGPLTKPLPPLGSTDDPQLSLVANVGTTVSWDEMRDEIALGTPGVSSDAVLDSLTIDEQLELQRLLAEEMAQPPVPGNRS